MPVYIIIYLCGDLQVFPRIFCRFFHFGPKEGTATGFWAIWEAFMKELELIGNQGSASPCKYFQIFSKKGFTAHNFF